MVDGEIQLAFWIVQSDGPMFLIKVPHDSHQGHQDGQIIVDGINWFH